VGGVSAVSRVMADGPLGAATADFSEDLVYRYRLSRVWDAGLPLLGWLMLNPSTADAFRVDPTVNRCVRFAQRDGFGGVVVTNLFALRSTDPQALYSHPDPVGGLNDRFIGEAASECALTVAAWGVHGLLHDRGAAVLGGLRAAGVDVRCVRLTKAGLPGHPLYVRGDSALVPLAG
jgi:hypothetical protein